MSTHIGTFVLITCTFKSTHLVFFRKKALLCRRPQVPITSLAQTLSVDQNEWNPPRLSDSCSCSLRTVENSQDPTSTLVSSRSGFPNNQSSLTYTFWMTGLSPSPNYLQSSGRPLPSLFLSSSLQHRCHILMLIRIIHNPYLFVSRNSKINLHS